MNGARKRLLAGCLAALALAVVARAEEPPAALLKQEERTHKRVVGELLRLAKYCATYRDYDSARAELGKALAILPAYDKLQKELDKYAGKESDPKDGFAERREERRAKAYAKCVQLLGKLAATWDRKGFPERFDACVALVRDHFPSDEAFRDMGLVYFRPYLQWVKASVEEKLRRGGELYEGRWLSPAEVATLDAEHATWKNPWIISDDVHEVRTTLPLRTARRLLAHVSTYRAFFLRTFAGSWDLQPPKGKLPVIVTETQADLVERAREYTGALAMESRGAAYYLQTNGSLDPCFVTLEPNVAGGSVAKIDLDDILIPLQHEITHQLAFEYCKHDYDPTRQIEHHFWCVEGIANFMQCYAYEPPAGWRLTRPRQIPLGNGYIEGAFAWCVQNRTRLPKLDVFMRIPHDRFLTVENYHIAATVTYFLLHGSGGRYRERFIRLLEAVHKVKERPETFARFFGDVDPEQLQREWMLFLNSIELE